MAIALPREIVLGPLHLTTHESQLVHYSCVSCLRTGVGWLFGRAEECDSRAVLCSVMIVSVRQDRFLCGVLSASSPVRSIEF